MTVNNNDILEFAVHGQGTGGKEMVNVYHFKYTGNASIADATCLTQAQTYLVSLLGSISLYLSNQATYSYVIVKNVTQSTEVGQINLSVAGGSASDALPFGTASLMTGRTNVLKRRARKFLWGLAEQFTSSQALTSAALTALTAVATKWVNGHAWDANTKRFVSGVLAAAGVVFTTLSSVAANGTPAYQRNRKPGA